MKKNASAVSVISGADGPTSVFIAKKSHKRTLRQKLDRLTYQIRRAYVEKTLTSESHSMDEVMEYIVNKYGFVEADRDCDEVAEEYKQMRASFMMLYEPKLLGEYATPAKLRGESPEDVEYCLKQNEERIKRAMEIPTKVFDIDFHKYVKAFDDRNDNMDIIIEKKYGYIGGGASGNKKLIKEYHRIYKDVYRYYGVTEDDIKNKTRRYTDLVKMLSR